MSDREKKGFTACVTVIIMLCVGLLILRDLGGAILDVLNPPPTSSLPTPTPGYLPLSGAAFVQNGRGEGGVRLRVCPGYTYKCARDSGVVDVGSQVEILQARWFVYRSQGCYFYQVREPSGNTGWLTD